jgi:SAM-dependent methyltransferase/uncharacterized protein YbaR (Trm112 family)
MLSTSLPLLRCPKIKKRRHVCLGVLSVFDIKKQEANDIIFGTLHCQTCEAKFPILAGVALLINDIEPYLQYHAKGISALVKDSDIPKMYRDAYLFAKSEIKTDFIEEDLESQRINALYYMNHYLRVSDSSNPFWWRPNSEYFSKEIDQFVKSHWDQGPFSKIADWTKSLKDQSVIELGCGVGGLAKELAHPAASYLGVDLAFASVALARHIYLNAPYSLPLSIPQDLLNGPLTGTVAPPKNIGKSKHIDFIVGELQNLPVARNHFDLSIALNAIDMMEDPSLLPKIQFDLLKSKGTAIQSCPYIWQNAAADKIRKSIPREINSSSAAVEYLYEKVGFKIFKKIEHLPWLFLKHFRQLEIYSVHMFAAKKMD